MKQDRCYSNITTFLYLAFLLDGYIGESIGYKDVRVVCLRKKWVLLRQFWESLGDPPQVIEIFASGEQGN